eukprot:15349062-Ditylum_brightwellii.AAC.1
MVVKQDVSQFNAFWIKAHQDNNKPYQELNLDAQLNVLADADVDAFHNITSEHLEPSITPTLFPLSATFITVNGCVITKKLNKWLCDNYTNSDIINHIHKKVGLTIPDMNLIDWDNLRAVLERQQLTTKMRLVKLMHDWLNMGHQKQTFNEDAVADCPVCDAKKETWTHMFQCQHEDYIAI